MKLNLGSGKDYRRGWVNVDLGTTTNFGSKIKLDVAHNLNKYPYPFKDDEFQEVYMRGILEHINDMDRCMGEIKRITSREAPITIIVPYFSSYFSYREMNTHKFSLNCSEVFYIFDKNKLKLIDKGYQCNNFFLKWAAGVANINNLSKNIYERFFSGIFPMNQVYWEVINKK